MITKKDILIIILIIIGFWAVGTHVYYKFIYDNPIKEENERECLKEVGEFKYSDYDEETGEVTEIPSGKKIYLWSCGEIEH